MQQRALLSGPSKPDASSDGLLVWLNNPGTTDRKPIVPEEWVECLDHLAAHRAEQKGVSPIDAWFEICQELLASVIHPDDELCGIKLAVLAWLMGLRYDEPRMYADLFDLYLEWHEADMEQDEEAPEDTDTAGAATAFVEPPDPFKFIVGRLLELGAALGIPLPKGTTPAKGMLDDPETVILGSKLLWKEIHSVHREILEAGGTEDDVPVDEFLELMAQYVWAAHHALAHKVDEDELFVFITSFEEWLPMMDAFVRSNTLEPGVLKILALYYERDDHWTPVNDIRKLIVFWKKHNAGMATLPEYLETAFTAVEHNA